MNQDKKNIKFIKDIKSEIKILDLKETWLSGDYVIKLRVNKKGLIELLKVKELIDLRD